MICRICNKRIDYDIDFSDLFSFSFICKSCIKLIKPKYTIIPINGGRVIYYFYFLVDDEYLKDIEAIAYSYIPSILVKIKRNKIFLLLDDEIIDYIPLINLSMDIVLFSVKYIELENYFLFDLEP